MTETSTSFPPDSARDGRRGYGIRFVQALLGNGARVDPALAERVARTLAGDEEVSSEERDSWGNWEWRFSERFPGEGARHPWLDEDVLASSPDMRRRPSEVVARWPAGHPFALCITHDVDVVSARGHGLKFVRRVRRMLQAEGAGKVAAAQAAGSLYRLATTWGGGDDVGRFEVWLDLEARHGFSSTWFFLPSRYRRVHGHDMDYQYDDRVVFDGRQMRVRDMMRAIASRGNEVGLHGSYCSSTDTDLLREQREQVEHAVGARVQSVRQHFLRYDPLLTPGVQAAAGLLCDSTLGYNMANGFRRGTSFPFRVWDAARNAVSPVLEIPLHVMDTALFGPMGLSGSDATAHCVELMDAVARVGGCLTINWHPNYVNNPEYVDVFAMILEEAARRNAWGCSVQQVYEWWVARERQLSEPVS